MACAIRYIETDSKAKQFSGNILQYDDDKRKFLVAMKDDKDVKVEYIAGQENTLGGGLLYNMDYEHNKDFNNFIDEIIEKYK